MQTVVTHYRDLARWDVKSFLLFSDIGENHVRLGTLLRKKQNQWDGTDDTPMLSLHFGGEFSQRESNQIKGKLFVADKGDLVYSKIDLRNGAIGIIPSQYAHALFTAEFPIYEINKTIIHPVYLQLYLQSSAFKNLINSIVSGASGRKRVKPSDFENLFVYVPVMKIQEEIVNDWNKAQMEVQKLNKSADELEANIDDHLLSALGIEKRDRQRKGGSFAIRFRDLDRWSLQYLLFKNDFLKTKYEIADFDSRNELFVLLTRGKSPKYEQGSDAIVLNQKCNRWNSVELEYAKKVNKKWLESIDNELKTKNGDIIINSTGEGTIGRASIIKDSFAGLYYDSHMLLLRVNSAKVDSEYFVNLFNSSFIQKQIDISKSAQSTNQTELGIDNVKKLSFPLPPLSKQREISAKVLQMRQDAKKMRKDALEMFQSARTDIEKALI